MSKKEPDDLVLPYSLGKEKHEAFINEVLEFFSNNSDYSLRQLAKEFRSRGYRVSPQAIRNWINTRGYGHLLRKARPKERNLAKGVDIRINMDVEIYKSLNMFDNKSMAVREMLRCAMGIPTRSFIINLTSTCRLFGLYDIKSSKYKLFLTEEIDSFEQKILAKMIDEADDYGEDVVRQFAKEYDLYLMGANYKDYEKENTTDGLV